MQTIFISSTFQDMQQERDLLRDHVLPLLKAESKRFGRSIELCDLRWGVNSLGMEKADRDIKVMQVCFREIDKAKPFFVVLLGSRYGWIPDAEIVGKILSSSEMQDPDYFGKSATEMEILYGALKSKEPARVFFYFRQITNAKKSLFFDNPDLPAIMKSASRSDAEHIEALKKRIIKQFPNNVRTYRVTWNAERQEFDGMEAFCETVIRDLTEAIREEYGNCEAASEYDVQLHQYEYACSEHVYIGQEEFLRAVQNGSLRQVSGLLLPVFQKQICLLVSSNTFGLHQIFSNLCQQWGKFANVIPYCCDQSMRSGSLHNLLAYYSAMLSRRLGKAEAADPDELPADRFRRLIQETDDAENGTVVLAIRGLDCLDEQELFRWLPLTPLRHIRFLLSTGHSPASPAAFQALSQEVYFPDQDIIDRRVFIRAYMSFFHKEADAQLCDAILEKSAGKEEQYMELLMQRLIVLSKQDFQNIKRNGGGIAQISAYLIGLTADAPDTAEALADEQIRLLRQETSPDFTETALGALTVLPFGIPHGLLTKFAASRQIPCSQLDLTLLSRRLSFAVRETLDGFYRYAPTGLRTDYSPISADALADTAHELEAFFSRIEQAAEPMDDDTLECYRNNRLFLAARCRNDSVLPVYLERTGHQQEMFALLLPHLTVKESVRAWLCRSVAALSEQDIAWTVHKLHRVLALGKRIHDPELAVPLTEVWKAIADRAGALVSEHQTRDAYENWFLALFQTGEAAHLHDLACAAEYLEHAKRVSGEAFERFPNRFWKYMHGIPLTPEEIAMDRDWMPEGMEHPGGDAPMFAFDSELSDMHMTQLWSEKVRIINSYLAAIYRRNGDTEKASALEKEVGTVTQMDDPDPLNRGNRELVPGISIIMPDEEPGRSHPHQKRPYKPDYRRNSALELSKEAGRLLSAMPPGKEEAAQKIRESSQILLEIFEDGETCERYDLHDVTEDPQKAAQRIRIECARDLSLNACDLIRALELREDQPELLRAIEEMLRWAEVYDSHVNNVQSKNDLEESYLLSAQVYASFARFSFYFDRILRDVSRYYHNRLETHKLGNRPSEHSMRRLAKADEILFALASACPERGDEIAALMHEHSNRCVIAEDINGSVQLTRDMETLLEWMWENGYFWKQPEYSLESNYISNMDNHSMLWEKYGQQDALRDYAARMSKNILKLQEQENVEPACRCIFRNVHALIGRGKIHAAADAAEPIMQAFDRFGTDGFRIPALQMCNTVIGAYSDAGRCEEAVRNAERALRIYNEITDSDYDAAAYHTSRSQIVMQTASEHARTYLFLSISLSRAGRKEEGKKALEQAAEIFRSCPGLADAAPDLFAGVQRFLREGLPDPDDSDVPAETERFHSQRRRIEDAFARSMRNGVQETDLQEIESLIAELTRLPEYEQSKTHYTMAKYYHVLSQMYADVRNKAKQTEMLKKAVREARTDREPCSLYAEIFSDCGALADETEQKLSYLHLSVCTFEMLEQQGEEIDPNSYAMALYNYGLVSAMHGDRRRAKEMTEKAIKVWTSADPTGRDQRVQAQLSQAKRLLLRIMLQ